MPAITFSKLSAELLELYSPPLRPKSTRMKMAQILREMGEVEGVNEASDLTPAAIARWIAIHQDRSNRTNKGHLGYVKLICDYAHQMEYVRVNPFLVRKVWIRADEPEDIVRHHPIADIDRVLTHMGDRAREDWEGQRLHALTSLVAWTGVRRNEALYAQVDDFDLPGRIFRVSAKRRRLKTAKSAAPVGIPDELAEILAEWFRAVGSECAFPNIRRRETPWTGGPTGKRPLDRMKSVAEEVGVEGFTFQSLRHSWATHSESLWGLPEGLIKRQLRHTTIRTQAHYRHPDLPNLLNAVRTISFKSRPRESNSHGSTPEPPRVKFDETGG